MKIRRLLAWALAGFTVWACGSNDAGPGATNGEPTSDQPDGGPNGDDARDSGSGDGSDGDGDSTDASIDAPIDGAGTDADADSGPPPSPAVRFVGRFDTSDPAGPKVAWPGARIIARFDGTQLSVSFAHETVSPPGGSRFDVTLDGTLQASPLVLADGTSAYPLATGLAPGAHTVELWLRTEELVGTSQFLGFDFGPGGALLAPPAAPSRRIEFLGDSASNGYGVDGNGPGCPFTPATENDHVAYPALVAHDLGADSQNLSFAGRGITWDYQRNDPLTYPVAYPRTLPFESTSVWNFAAFTPDVVWIALGGNDWDQPNPGDPPPDLTTFETAYADFVATVRAKHPAAHIVLAIASSLNDDYPPGYAAYTNMKTAIAYVVGVRAAAMDTKVYAFEFTRATDADLTGCEYHPNRAKHRAMADEAITFIKSKTGWP